MAGSLADEVIRVRTVDAAAGGTGLLGLSERLARLGGSITAQRPRSGHFRLEATLPASGAAAMPPDPDPTGSPSLRSWSRSFQGASLILTGYGRPGHLKSRP